MIKGNKLEAFINEHCKKAIVRLTISHWWSQTKSRPRQHGFFTVVKPMHVFKHVRHGENNSTRAIANLVIPVGAMIYVNDIAFSEGAVASHRKMRASEAFVHSIAAQRSGQQVHEATSSWTSMFKYIVGKTVKPMKPFCKVSTQCESGIHFFVNLADAKSWM
jgi:hypothetical protein